MPRRRNGSEVTGAIPLTRVMSKWYAKCLILRLETSGTLGWQEDEFVARQRKETHDVRGRYRRPSTQQDQSTLRTFWKVETFMGGLHLRFYVFGKVTRSSKFVQQFTRCILQESVEAQNGSADLVECWEVVDEEKVRNYYGHMSRWVASNLQLHVGRQFIDFVTLTNTLGTDDERLDRRSRNMRLGAQTQQVGGGQTPTLTRECRR